MENKNREKFDKWFDKYCDKHAIQNRDEDIKELALTAFEKGFKVGIEVALSN